MTLWPQREVAVNAGAQVEVGSLPFLLAARSWDIELDITPSHRSLDALAVEVTAPGTVIHHLDRDAAEVVSDTTLRWRFDQPWLSFATGIVVRAHAATPSIIELPVRLRPVDGW